eukprot:6019410-Pyramimonas_sp.AAC.1
MFQPGFENHGISVHECITLGSSQHRFLLRCDWRDPVGGIPGNVCTYRNRYCQMHLRCVKHLTRALGMSLLNR